MPAASAFVSGMAVCYAVAAALARFCPVLDAPRHRLARLDVLPSKRGKAGELLSSWRQRSRHLKELLATKAREELPWAYDVLSSALKRVEERRLAAEAERHLGDVLDLMATCVTAGIALADVFEVVGKGGRPPLSWLFGHMGEGIRAGKSPADALDDLEKARAYRGGAVPAPVAKLVRSLDQATRLGTPLAGFLAEEAESWRARQAARAERRASMIPVKLAVCTTVLLVPSTMLMVLTPNIITFTKGW